MSRPYWCVNVYYRGWDICVLNFKDATVGQVALDCAVSWNLVGSAPSLATEDGTVLDSNVPIGDLPYGIALQYTDAGVNV